MMHNWSTSDVMFDEDCLENFLSKIKNKIQEAWKAGYTPDAECEMTFEQDEE